jgi:hypothetical protein
MEETGLLDDAVLVVMADHGVAFRPGAPVKGNTKQEPVEAILPEMAWVPLFVRAPENEGGRIDDRNALLVDVLPTIADAIDLDLPERDGEVGESLLGPPRRSETKPWFHASDSDFFGVDLGPRLDLPRDGQEEVFALGAGALSSTDDDELRSYAIGPRADLVGRSVDDLDAGAPATVRADVDLAPFSSVDTGEGEVPAMVTGELSGTTGERSAVAFALNGRIGAVSPVFPDVDAAAAFVALLPEDWFRDGDNELELYLVSTEPGDLSARVLGTR